MKLFNFLKRKKTIEKNNENKEVLWEELGSYILTEQKKVEENKSEFFESVHNIILEHSADIEKNLQLMTGIEFACGEDALQKRTRYVAKTFELLQDTGSVRQPAASVNRRISELQIQQLQNAERLSLRNSILQQNRRLQLEADQRQDNLEKELLRQEINSAPFPGN